MDGARHIFGGKSQVCNSWFSGSKRKANLNWFENDWNDYCWFAFARDSLHSPAKILAGVFNMYLCQSFQNVPILGCFFEFISLSL